MSRNVVLLFFVLCSAFGKIAWAQNDVPKTEKIRYDDQLRSPVHFDQEKIETYQNDPDFNYVEAIPADNWWTQFKDWVSRVWNQFWNWLLGSYTASDVVVFIIRILPYLVLAALLGLIVWLFVRLNPAESVLRERSRPGVQLSDEEEILEREDISELIQRALRDENYRLATRFYYLLILKKMRDLHLIDYQFQKTNEEYISEIKPLTQKKQFKELTHIYEFIWYGDFPMTEPDFRKAESEFSKMTHLLNPSALGKTL